MWMFGLPNSTYDFNSITATVNNQSIPTYNISQIDKGITVDLGSMAIQPGRSGTVYLRVGTISNLLYKSNKAGYAHFSFRPNWFGSDYVYGSTNVVVTLYLPAGMTSDEPIYDLPKILASSDTPQSWNDDQGRVAYQWNTADGSGDGQYTFGASFPARLVPSDALQNAPLISLTSDDIGNILCWGGGLVCAGLIILLSSAAQRRLKNVNWLTFRQEFPWKDME